MGGVRVHLLTVWPIVLGIAVLVPVVLLHDSLHEETRISTDHLEITAYVREGAAASFSLVLDIDSEDGIRVYAA